jgi:uncharacterized membrane protein YqiK
MMKKAQSISINTIIVAVIALVVLVIIVAIFAGRMGLFGKDLSTVQAGSTCKSDRMQIALGANCESLGQGWQVIYGNFQQCKQDEQPENTGCMKAGYVCCSK